jgi:hypothetical protein
MLLFLGKRAEVCLARGMMMIDNLIYIVMMISMMISMTISIMILMILMISMILMMAKVYLFIAGTIESRAFSSLTVLSHSTDDRVSGWCLRAVPCGPDFQRCSITFNKAKTIGKKTVEHIESMPGKLQRNLKYVS